MRDAIDAIRGIPAVMAASSGFRRPARMQAEALGMPGIADGSVFVPHPIQDATDDEMRAKARDAIDAIPAALTAGP